MERIAKAALLVALTAALAGCFESARPLSQPGTVARDRAILGHWNCVPDPQEKPDDRATLLVWPFDASQYYAEWTEGPNTTRYRAYGSRIGSTTLLNVLEMKIAREDAKWAFVRYRFEGDRLRIAVVKDDAVRGATEAAKLEDIRRRAANDALYQRFAVCTRPAG
jgi:hypothetical protein